VCAQLATLIYSALLSMIAAAHNLVNTAQHASTRHQATHASVLSTTMVVIVRQCTMLAPHNLVNTAGHAHIPLLASLVLVVLDTTVFSVKPSSTLALVPLAPTADHV